MNLITKLQETTEAAQKERQEKKEAFYKECFNTLNKDNYIENTCMLSAKKGQDSAVLNFQNSPMSVGEIRETLEKSGFNVTVITDYKLVTVGWSSLTTISGTITSNGSVFYPVKYITTPLGY